MNDLNRFSKEVYNLISSYNPRLVSQAQMTSEPDGNFYLEIRSPIKETDIWLGIYTEADPPEDKPEATGEVTWELDYYHSHSFDRNAREAFEWLKEELDGLFAGRKFIGSRVDNGKWLGSRELSKHQVDEFLAGKLDFTSKIDQIMRLPNISDSKKEFYKKKLLDAAHINRVVGWEKIYSEK